MSSVVATMNEHSERFLPAFALLKGVQRGQAGTRYTPLDLHMDESGPVTAAGEQLLGRWIGLASCLITVTTAGTPIGVDGIQSGSPVQLFDGPCDIMLTQRRLVILVLDGPTAVGKVGGKTGLVLAAVFPLDRVDYAQVDLKNGFRGPKEQRLTIGNISNSFSALNLQYVEMIWESGRFVRFRGTMRNDILEPLVAPVVAARRPSAAGADLAELDNVLAGKRIRTPTEVCAQFVPD